MPIRYKPAASQPNMPRLTLVSPTKSIGHLDWSKLMARAQEGDREAYRTLLQEIEPYIRSVSTRCFRQAIDVEDAVQDVLLTVHAIRHTYDPIRPSSSPDAPESARDRTVGGT